MLLFLGKRLLQLIPTLFFVSVIIFGLQQLLPGDPALAMAGEERDPAVLEQIRREYRLDQPIYIQYLYWIGGVLSGNLGESMRLKEPVLTLITQKFPGDAAAGPDGDRHLALDRGHRRRRLGGEEEYARSTTP